MRLKIGLKDWGFYRVISRVIVARMGYHTIETESNRSEELDPYLDKICFSLFVPIPSERAGVRIMCSCENGARRFVLKLCAQFQIYSL